MKLTCSVIKRICFEQLATVLIVEALKQSWKKIVKEIFEML